MAAYFPQGDALRYCLQGFRPWRAVGQRTLQILGGGKISLSSRCPLQRGRDESCPSRGGNESCPLRRGQGGGLSFCFVPRNPALARGSASRFLNAEGHLHAHLPMYDSNAAVFFRFVPLTLFILNYYVRLFLFLFCTPGKKTHNLPLSALFVLLHQQ